MYFLLALGLASCACIISAQTIAPARAACTQDDLAGTRTRPSPGNCDLYEQCQVDGTSLTQSCAGGTLYNPTSGICDYPWNTKCPGITCGQGQSGTIRLGCCNQFLRCVNGKLTIVTCPRGQRFDSRSGGCSVNSACISHPICPADTSSGQPAQCFKFAVNNPCAYRQMGEGGVDFGVMPCSAGTGFNATACDCSIRMDACSPLSTYTNGVPDLQCPATLGMDFSNSQKVTSYTLKTASGQREANKYFIQAMGYSSANNEAVLGGNGYLAIPFFINNMYKGSFGMSVTFAASMMAGLAGQSFSLITNGVASRADCAATLDVSASYSGGQWTVSLRAVGQDQTGVVTLSQSLAASPQSYIKVTVIFNSPTQNIWAVVRDMTQNGAPLRMGPKNIGSLNVAKNNCQLYVGRGLNGRLREVNFYEACGNTALLDNTVG